MQYTVKAMASGVYKLAFKKTGEIYVGSSADIEKRFAQHIYNMSVYARSPGSINKSSSGLTRTSLSLGCDPHDLNLVAINYDYEILEIVEDIALLIDRECDWYDVLMPTLNKTRPRKKKL